MTKEMTVDYNNIDRALLTADRNDSVQIGINSILEAQKDPNISAAAMAEMEIAKNCFLAIRRTDYLEADLARNVKNIGYYNLVKYMKLVCKNLNNYVSRSFGVEVFYEENSADYANKAFDGRIVEKCILDAVYNIISAGKGKTKKITLYMDYSQKFMQFCIKSNFGTDAPKRNLSEIALLYPEAASKLNDTSYADLAAQQLGGYAKYKYLKNVTRVEVYIPNNLKVLESCMREGETAICCDEVVMVYKVLSEGYMNDFFADLKYKLS